LGILSASKKRTVEMAKKSRPAKKDAMPYVVAFVVCQHVLVEKDDVNSAIRIVDTVTLPAESPLKAGDSILLPGLSMLLILKSGDARGKLEMKLRLVTPESPPVRHEAAAITFSFAEPPESGMNSRVEPLSIVWAGQGLYLFEVTVGDELLARTPLRIRVDDTKAKKG
jgi:hypothetical protein